LTIDAFDLSFGDSTVGGVLGSASGVADPHLTGTTNNNVNISNRSILQHYVDITDTRVTTRQLESVATAVIVVNAPAGHVEYPTPSSYDIRLAITGGSGLTIVDHHLDFNILVTTVGGLSTSQKVYFGMDVSVFVQLPATGVGLDPNIAFVDLPPDGQAPGFDQLVKAINLVLGDDPGAPNGSLIGSAALTPAQARHVAAEIVWNRVVYPPPQPTWWPPGDHAVRFPPVRVSLEWAKGAMWA
jgi:hypothetical protein